MTTETLLLADAHILYATEEAAFFTSHKKIMILFVKRCKVNDEQQKHYLSCYIIPSI